MGRGQLERADVMPQKACFRLQRADFNPEWLDCGCRQERADLRIERADFRHVRADFRPIRGLSSDLCGG